MSRYWNCGIVAVIAVGLLPAALAGNDVRQVTATDESEYTSVVFPNGEDFPPDFSTKYPFISDNFPWQGLFVPGDVDGIDGLGAAIPVYYSNIYTADALEIMAAIYGGKAEDYWKPIEWDFDPAQHIWIPTLLPDAYPYTSTGRTYAGGGRILLKATNESGALTPFNLGTWDPNMSLYSFSLEILADCVLEGEVLGETYPSESPLAGKNKMAEFVNGVAGIVIDFDRYPFPFKGYASKVTLKNFVMRDAFLSAILVFGGPWMTQRLDVVVDNVHILDVFVGADSSRMPILSHVFNGSFRVTGSSVINTKPSPSIADIAVGLSPNGWVGHVDNEVTNCTFRLPSTPWGSTAVVIDGSVFYPFSPDFTQTTRCTGNSIEADVGFEVGSNYVGAATISNNPGAGGCFKARTMGFNVSTPESGTTVLIDKNTVAMDSASSEASFLPFSAAFFGWGYSFAELNLWQKNKDDLGEPHNVVFSNNKVTGTADVGVFLGETASNNVFRANNIGQLNLNLGLTYKFGDDTRNNTVVGHTGGAANVYQGSTTNTLTGPGFRGLGREAAQRVNDAVAAAKQRAGSMGMNPQALAWYKYCGPIAR